MAKHQAQSGKHAAGKHAANPKASGKHTTDKHSDKGTSRASSVTDAGKLLGRGYDPTKTERG